MKLTPLFALLAVFALTGTAHASTIDVTLGATANPNKYDYSFGGSLSPDVDLTDTSELKLGTNSAVVNGGSSFGGLTNSPSGSLYKGEYLLVASGGKATFSIAKGGDTFGLTWGSIDSYNTLLVTTASGVTYKITGTEILDNLTGSTAGTTQENVIISAPSDIVKVVLESTSNSFEAANFAVSKAVSAVPLPASAVLFMIALAGLFVFGRRAGRAV